MATLSPFNAFYVLKDFKDLKIAITFTRNLTDKT